MKCDENLVLLCYDPYSFPSCFFSKYFLKKIKNKKSFNGQLVTASSYLIFTHTFSTVTVLPCNSQAKQNTSQSLPLGKVCQPCIRTLPSGTQLFTKENALLSAGSFAFYLTGFFSWSLCCILQHPSRLTQRSLAPFSTRAVLLPGS